jgi:hypothetical protein
MIDLRRSWRDGFDADKYIRLDLEVDRLAAARLAMEQATTRARLILRDKRQDVAAQIARCKQNLSAYRYDPAMPEVALRAAAAEVPEILYRLSILPADLSVIDRLKRFVPLAQEALDEAERALTLRADLLQRMEGWVHEQAA